MYIICKFRKLVITNWYLKKRCHICPRRAQRNRISLIKIEIDWKCGANNKIHMFVMQLLFRIALYVLSSNTLKFAEIIHFLSGKSCIRTQLFPKLDESACIWKRVVSRIKCFRNVLTESFFKVRENFFVRCDHLNSVVS